MLKHSLNGLLVVETGGPKLSEMPPMAYMFSDESVVTAEDLEDLEDRLANAVRTSRFQVEVPNA